MTKNTLLLLLPLLHACALPTQLGNSQAQGAGHGELRITLMEPHGMEVELDGRQYRGEWRSELCLNPECRGVYRNVDRLHRRHIRKGQASLVADDGKRLDCEWVSHLPELEGICRDGSDRSYRLTGKSDQP
ncbi:MAG: hypothetical protein AB1899_12470 [Pseudomonadota bacterium]